MCAGKRSGLKRHVGRTCGNLGDDIQLSDGMKKRLEFVTVDSISPIMNLSKFGT